MSQFARRVAGALGAVLQRLDAALRAWETAGLALLLLALVLAVAMLVER